jgi:hypothetical protein
MCEVNDEQSGIWTGFSPGGLIFPVSIIPPMFHTASTRCSYQKDKRTNAWETSNAVSEIGRRWIENNFHFCHRQIVAVSKTKLKNDEKGENMRVKTLLRTKNELG